MPTQDQARLFAEAVAAGAARDYERAINLLTSLLAEGDAPLEALLFLGRSHHALGSWGRAVDSFRAYLRSSGSPGPGWFFLGRTLLASGLSLEAARALARSVEAEPGRAGSWALLGAAELKLKKSTAAVAHLERAVELAPEDARVYRGYLNALFVKGVRSLQRGEADLAAQTLRFVIDNGLDATATRLWRARALKELGRFDEALVECDAASAWSPEDTSIRWLRAGLLLASNRKAEAFAVIGTLGTPESFQSGQPGDSASLELLRAATAFRQGRWREAVDAASAALLPGTTLPARGRAGLHALAAESLRMLGQPARARLEAEKAIEADPSAPDLRISLALILWDLGEIKAALEATGVARARGVDPAMAEYISDLCKARLGLEVEAVLARLQEQLGKRSRRGEPPDPRLLFAIGECLYRLERPDLAGGWFEKVLALEPAHELALLYRISVAESLSDDHARAQACAAYLERFPDNHSIRRELAELMALSGDWAEVAKVLEEGLTWSESGPAARRMLARAWRETGRFREGAVLYRDLLLADPEDGELLMALCLCLSRDDKTSYAMALLEAAPPAALGRSGPWIVKGMLAERLGRVETAIDSYRRATELEPRLERPWKDLQRMYAARGLVSFALEAEAEATRIGSAAKTATKARGGAASASKGSKEGSGADSSDIPKPRRPRSSK